MWGMINIKISDIITMKDIQSWNSGDVITIKAGTGKGKSYFIKNNLYDFAKQQNKKILMLIHRLNCIDQFKEEIKTQNKTDVIDIKSYQSLEYRIENGIDVDFSKYSYIICDEFHYFMSDAIFNKTTDISLNKILEQTNKIKIFMSATGDFMKQYFNNVKNIKTINYEINIDYDFIGELIFFLKDISIENLLQEIIESDEKAIFFIQSAKKAYNLYKKYSKYTLFNCSESNREYYKYVDKHKIDCMLKNEKFYEKALITTTTMDTGVNIKDNDVKHIICDVEDVGVLIQCLGRRRIDDNIPDDKLFVYIKAITNNQLGGKKLQINKKLSRAKYFKKYGDVEYVKKYGRNPDKNAIIYEYIGEDGTTILKKLNEMAYYKSLIDKKIVNKMLEHSYIEYVRKMFDKKYIILEEEKENKNLKQYLDSIVGQKLYRLEQKILIDVFKDNGLIAKSTGINTLNGNIKDRGLPYIIDIGKRKSYRDKKTGKVKKEKSHWIVGKIIY